MRGGCCHDCAMALANGYPSVEGAEAGWLERFMHEVSKGEQHYTILFDGTERGFSMAPCDVCRSPLGGDRWEVVFDWELGDKLDAMEEADLAKANSEGSN